MVFENDKKGDPVVNLRDLLKRSVDGDDQAFDLLVNHTKGDVYSLAYRWTKDRELAFDICQEAFIKLYKFLPKWDYSCHIKTWLYRVVTNVCIDYHRKNKHSFSPLGDEESDEQLNLVQGNPSANPCKELQAKEGLNQIENCIGTLPQKMQQSFRLKYICGLSLKEIAEIQGRSIGTIKATIHQAVHKLRTKLRTLEEEDHERSKLQKAG